jgi:NTP pyrophosphatase (non-canonical NTP hydrolase)
MKFESAREKAMADVEAMCKRSASYNEGFTDGFSDGYDRAIEDTKKIIAKYNLGEDSEEYEPELKPAVKFLKQPTRQLLAKVVEEVNEVIAAYEDGESTERIAEELGDVQLAAETAMASLGQGFILARERREVRMKDIKKNMVRGYYKIS